MTIARLELDEFVGTGADGERLFGASRDLAPLYSANRCFGMMLPGAPTKASAQNGVGFLKRMRTVRSSTFSTVMSR
jgi:hypothetical protein